MGVTWVKGSPGQLASIPEMILERIRKQAADAMQEVILQAVEDAKRFTATRPSPNSGKSGRVDTGEMMEAIMGRTIQEGADRIVGEFGFLNQMELYYQLQTVTGFQNWLSGDFIEPTFALRDAARIAIQNLLAKMGA